MMLVGKMLLFFGPPICLLNLAMSAWSASREDWLWFVLNGAIGIALFYCWLSCVRTYAQHYDR